MGQSFQVLLDSGGSISRSARCSVLLSALVPPSDYLKAQSGPSPLIREVDRRAKAGTPASSAKCQKRTFGPIGPNTVLGHAAFSTRVSISLRSAPKSIGFVKSASAPPSNALRLVSASP
jgi:hypothetical protein